MWYITLLNNTPPLDLSFSIVWKEECIFELILFLPAPLGGKIFTPLSPTVFTIGVINNELELELKLNKSSYIIYSNIL